MVPKPFALLPIGGFAVALFAASAFAAETIEAIGERCRKPRKSYTVEFLAPENAEVEASARGMAGGSEDPHQDSPALSLDGRPRPNGRCTFSAVKGRTYTLVTTGAGLRLDSLGISVTRP